MNVQKQYIIQKLWKYGNILRDEGLSYDDYIEQLTYLLFLKIAYERTQEPFYYESLVPAGLGWETLSTKDGYELVMHYRYILNELSMYQGTLGIIFHRATNKIQNPVHLHRLVAELIDSEQWTKMEIDVKGDAYEGLLEKIAEDPRSGAGQYFTPRSLIHAIVDVVQPTPMQKICDPACGTGGFLVAASDYISHNYKITREERRFLKNQAFQGWEIVDSIARLCTMNLLLHGIGDENSLETPIHIADSLHTQFNDHFDTILTNPPIGRISSLYSYESTIINRRDFWAITSNKQLNFVQLVYSLLKVNGQAAIVVPDNVLFEGGAGENIRHNLLQNCDVHTLLRLPSGIFYAQGVKANVLFFEKCRPNPTLQKRQLWVYDLRTNMNFTLRTNPLTRAHLNDFVSCYHPVNRHERQENERFRAFNYEELFERDKLNLDLFWLADESLGSTDELLPPDEIAASIMEDLQNALEQLRAIAEDLGEQTDEK